MCVRLIACGRSLDRRLRARNPQFARKAEVEVALAKGSVKLLETGGARVQNIPRFRYTRRQESTMSKIATKRQVKTEPRVERPRLHKVILFNDDYTPRDFVVEVLKGVFRLNETQALNVMVTAHRKGVCVVAVFAQDIAETKAARATEAGAAKGYPLRFGTEPEE
jgi:ATP-dependent Clp protease adaptor protein ClpS